MTKSNLELLQNNKDQVLAFTQNVINTPQQQSDNTYPPNIKNRLQTIKAEFEKENYGHAISLLDELKDNRLNIIWKTSEDLGNGTACRVRDARNIRSDQLLLDAPEKYQMQLINQFRGAVDLINLSAQDSQEKTNSINQLKFVVSQALDDPDIGSSNIRQYNTKMLSVLEDAKIENAVDRLKFATEMSNFKDPHYHIVTLSHVNDSKNHGHTAIEADIMLNGLTEEQRNNYRKIAKYKPLQNSATGVSWFDQMDDPIEKTLLSQQANNTADDNKVIPAQCIGQLEGIRNGYMKVTAISDEEGQKAALIILSENLHCGAPASKIKNVSPEEKDQIVTRNIEQLKSYVASDKVLNLNSLNSSTPFDARGENFIINQVKAASTKDVNSVKVSVSPINKWRWLGGGRDTKVFQETLKTIGDADVIKEATPNISKYLRSDRSPRIEKLLEKVTFGAYKSLETKARKELSTLSSDDKNIQDLRHILGVAIDARKLTKSSVLLSSFENINLELSSKMNQIENAINLPNGALNQKVSSSPYTVDFCKSGKDRTGLVMFNNTVDVINAHLGLLDNSPHARNNRDSIAKSGHTQEMAGIQGGTIGCHSLKTNPEFGLNKSDQHLNEILGQKSSHFNSTIKTIDDLGQKAKIIEEFKNSYSAQVAALHPKTPNNAKQAQFVPKQPKKPISPPSKTEASKMNKSFSSTWPKKKPTTAQNATKSQAR